MQISADDNLIDIVSSAPIGICILNAKTLVTELLNDAFLEVVGKTYEQIYGRFYWDVFAEVRHLFEDDLLSASKGETIRGEELEVPLIRYGKQQMIIINFVYAPIKNKNGDVTKVAVWVLENTNQIKQREALTTLKENLAGANSELGSANEELAATNEELTAINEELQQAQESLLTLNLNNIVRQAPVGMCIIKGAPLYVEEANDIFLEIIGKERAAFKDTPYWVVNAEAAQYYEPITDKILSTGETYRADEHEIMLIRQGSPEMVHVDFVYEPIKNINGDIDGIMIVAIDVTDKVLARRSIEQGVEEIAAINEELAASNEEMRATNEELASVNEELIRAQTALEDSENQLRFTLNAIPTQVWTATPEGALDYVNQVVCEDFGYNTEEIVGHGWQEFIHPDDLANCLQHWIRALKSGNQYVVEFRLKFRDGNYYWHLARAVPFYEDGNIKLWLGTNTNIDVQKQAEQTKDEFLSIASHELKTPLTSIKLYNQLIRRAKDDVQIKSFTEKTSNHILRLERLISDLLDVTKINAGKMNYALESFDFGQMISDSVEVMAPGSNKEIVIGNNVSIDYTGDKFRLEQVMNNFLSNAIKYSPDGKKVIVSVVVEHKSIIVSVQDFGIGIDRESIDRLFDRYYRADNAAMRFEGLGLGLFISSEILKRHNGSFWIESEKGKGSTFYFRLPLDVNGISGIPVVTNTTYQHETLTINYLGDAGRIEVDWTGFQDLASVKTGCIAMLDMVVKTKCDRIVNDNTHVLGNWSEAAEWVGNEWFPMMEKAGVKYFAHIFSASTFSQLAAQKSIDIMAGIITTQYFTDIELARQWIDNCAI